MDAQFLVDEINAAIARGHNRIRVHLPGAGIPLADNKHPADKAEITEHGYVRVTTVDGDNTVVDPEHVRLFESMAPDEETDGTGTYT